LGAYFRFSAFLFFACFSYLHALDATHYINHYYLLSLLYFLLALSPAGQAISWDVRRGAVPPLSHIPAFYIWMFRLQLGLVYFFAGLAKLNSDWLLRAMPLRIWLLQSQDFPLLGPMFGSRYFAFGMSYLGAFYDLTIAFWLLWARTRPWAYLTVLGFHLLTGALFDIGLFPPLMMASTLIFFSGAEHERWARYWGYAPQNGGLSQSLPFVLPFWAYGYWALQFLLPLRAYVYSGNVLWTEQGYRFGWRVMLTEKEGWSEFRVKDLDDGRVWEVSPQQHLDGYQIKRMLGQPEHLRQYARFLARDYALREGIRRPAVYADVFISLNARPSKRLLCPDCNLLEERPTADFILSD
jgi:hypothetical protein